MNKETEEFKIVRVSPENHDTTSIYFTGPEIERFRGRRAGQFASIRVPREGAWSEPHPFTISCSPEAGSLRMTIKNSGEFTRKIRELVPGTPIQCAGPFGKFCADIDSRPRIVMMAGGVGITPFLSVLRHFLRTGAKNSVMLFWANKTPQDAFAAEELAEMTKFLELAVIHVYSRVAPEERRPAPVFSDGRPGNISHEYGRIDRHILARHIAKFDAAFYLCGPTAMQKAVIAELAECGVPAGAVQTEVFAFPTPKFEMR